MMPLKPLLRRSPLLPGESLPSLLVRLAEKNGYPNLNLMLNLGNEFLLESDSLTCPNRPETLAMLATLTGLDTLELYGASIHRWAESLIAPGFRHFEMIELVAGIEVAIILEPARQQHFWPEDEVQFCPYCLAEQPYHRVTWILQAAPVCLEHHCLLVKTCPSCEAGLSVTDVVQGKCKQCEFDLTLSPSDSITGDRWGQISQQVIQSWFGAVPGSSEVEGLPHQPSAVLYQILSFLRRAICAVEKQWDYLHNPFDIEAVVNVFPCHSRSQLTPLRSYLIYATAMTALREWPSGFYRFLDAYRLRDQREQTDTGPEDLGYLYNLRQDERFHQHPAYYFLQQAFGQYVQENFQYSFALQKMRRLQPTGALPAHLEYVSVAETARMLQLNPALVKRLLELGYLSDYQPPDDHSTRRLNLVLQQDVLDLQVLWRGIMPSADAARLLGVSDEILMDLVEAGLIRTVPVTTMRPEEPSKGIECRSLADLIDRLRQGPVRYLYTQRLETVPLNTLAEQGEKIANIIQSILAVKIRAFWPPSSPNLAHLVVVVEDIV